MLLLRLAERIVFEWRRRFFLAVLAAATLVKTGIWLAPNIGDGLRIAQDPFALTIAEPAAQYLMSSWLAPFLAWLVGARTGLAFVLVYLGYALSYLALVVTLAFRGLPEREARIALVIFAAIPASATGLFWISHDGLTLLLVVVILALRARPALAGLAGVALGLQHFEQAVFGFAALGLASAASPSFGGRAPVSNRFSIAVLAGLCLGKLILVAVFHTAGIAPQGRFQWLTNNLPTLLANFWFHAHVVVFAARGLGWLVVLRHADRGRAAVPFLAALAGLLPLVAIADDQTRVFAVVSLPLLYAFWLTDAEFLRALSGREVAGFFVLWLVVPWAWTWSGVPTWSVLPYDLTVIAHALFGGMDLPPAEQFGHWPFAAGR